MGAQPAGPEGYRLRLEWLTSALLACLPLLAALVAVLDARVDGPIWMLIGLVLGQSLALVWCRRFPLTVLLVVTALEAALVVADMELLVGFLAATCGLGAWAGHRQQRAGLTFGFALMGLIVTASLNAGNRPGYVIPGTAALAALFAGFWLVGRLSAGHLRRFGELTRYSRRLEQERARATARERTLLARELHDILNHAVTAMVLDADATAETGDERELREGLRRLAATGRGSLAELRRLLGVLRTAPGSIDHDPLAVLPGLEEVETLLASTPRARLERHGTPRPADASVGQAAYRVVQEALTNVGKHAGPVDVTVSLAYTPTTLTVRVRNAPPAGRGAVVGGGGLGLIGMRERVELVGGTLSAGRHADGGFEVTATLPMRDES